MAGMARSRNPHQGHSPGRRTSGTGPKSVAAAEADVAAALRRGRIREAQSTSGPAATTPLRPPNARHHLNGIRPASPAKAKNTVVLPGTDVAADLADISAGRATWNADDNRYEVNGRTYGMESTGTVFPVSGPGFVNLSRSEYKVLKQLIGSVGDVDAARAALRRDPSVEDADWGAALDVFRHHKSYRGGA